MNRCEYCLEHLSSYIDGEMSENEMKEIEEHLKECNSCAYEFNILKTIVSTCSELEEELPDGFSSSLHTRLEKAQADLLAERKRKGKIKVFSQIAAGFILVVTLGFAIRSGFFGGGLVDGRLMSGSKSAPDAAPMAKGPSVVEFSAPKVSGKKAGESTGAAEDGAKNESFATAQGVADAGEQPDNKESEFTIQFSEERAITSSKVKYDTEITIIVDDIGKAIESIMAIDEKVGKSRESNTAYLQDSIQAYRGSTRSNVVELKLVYTSEKVEQCFIKEILSAFPDTQVDSVPSADKDETEDDEEAEEEYIKIIIEKKK